jgi:hypothetical protein
MLVIRIQRLFFFLVDSSSNESKRSELKFCCFISSNEIQKMSRQSS